MLSRLLLSFLYYILKRIRIPETVVIFPLLHTQTHLQSRDCCYLSFIAYSNVFALPRLLLSFLYCTLKHICTLETAVIFPLLHTQTYLYSRDCCYLSFIAYSNAFALSRLLLSFHFTHARGRLRTSVSWQQQMRSSFAHVQSLESSASHPFAP